MRQAPRGVDRLRSAGAPQARAPASQHSLCLPGPRPRSSAGRQSCCCRGRPTPSTTGLGAASCCSAGGRRVSGSRGCADRWRCRAGAAADAPQPTRRGASPGCPQSECAHVRTADDPEGHGLHIWAAIAAAATVTVPAVTLPRVALLRGHAKPVLVPPSPLPCARSARTVQAATVRGECHFDCKVVPRRRTCAELPLVLRHA